jgi:integral membrane sensor domain MASE1
MNDTNSNSKKTKSTPLKLLQDYQPIIAIFSAFMVAGAFLYNTNLYPKDPRFSQLIAGSIFLGGFYGILWVILLSIFSARDSQVYRYIKEGISIFLSSVVIAHLATGIIGLFLIIPKIKPSENIFLYVSYVIQLFAFIMLLAALSILLITFSIIDIYYKIYKKRKQRSKKA